MAEFTIYKGQTVGKTTSVDPALLRAIVDRQNLTNPVAIVERMARDIVAARQGGQYGLVILTEAGWAQAQAMRWSAAAHDLAASPAFLTQIASGSRPPQPADGLELVAEDADGDADQMITVTGSGRRSGADDFEHDPLDGVETGIVDPISSQSDRDQTRVGDPETDTDQMTNELAVGGRRNLVEEAEHGLQSSRRSVDTVSTRSGESIAPDAGFVTHMRHVLADAQTEAFWTERDGAAAPRPTGAEMAEVVEATRSADARPGALERAMTTISGDGPTAALFGLVWFGSLTLCLMRPIG